jgi:hypothetical protein
MEARRHVRLDGRLAAEQIEDLHAAIIDAPATELYVADGRARGFDLSRVPGPCR